jgi:ferrous iron transport protein A
MITLAKLEKGQTAKINGIQCGECLKKRLADLGLCNGTLIKIIKNDKSGPMIISVKGTKLAIGRGQAEKITVNPCE